MKNKIQDGKTLSYANSGSLITSGSVVVMGSRIAVATADISTGKSGSVETEGVFELPSVTNAAFAFGDRLFWDANPGVLTKIAADNIPAGECVAAKLEAGATARVKLESHPVQAAKVADASAGSAAEINALRDAFIAAGLMKNT